MDRNTEQRMKERIAWYVGKLEGLGANRDDRHEAADRVLLDCLADAGYEEVVAAYRRCQQEGGFFY